MCTQSGMVLPVGVELNVSILDTLGTRKHVPNIAVLIRELSFFQRHPTRDVSSFRESKCTHILILGTVQAVLIQ